MRQHVHNVHVYTSVSSLNALPVESLIAMSHNWGIYTPHTVHTYIQTVAHSLSVSEHGVGLLDGGMSLSLIVLGLIAPAH